MSPFATTTRSATKPGAAKSSSPADAAGARLRFAFAGPEDDAELRALLRRNPMRGAISVGFAHEPGYFLGVGLAGAEDRTLLARLDGRLVAAGRCVIRSCWLNGAPRRCAYLGELRLDEAVRGRADILLRGYAFFAADYARDPADFCFTSIVADNTRARRALEHGIRGLPRYEFLDEFNTLLLRTPSGASPRLPAGVELVTGDDLPRQQLIAFLNTTGSTRNLATHWTPERLSQLESHGLGAKDFFALRRDGELLACAAIWDQRSFRQVVVHDYAGWLRSARPVINLFAPLFGWPNLPEPGATLAHACLSPIAVRSDATLLLPTLVRICLAAAAQREIDTLAIGLSHQDPLWRIVAKNFRGRRYASRLHAVTWPDISSSSAPDSRPLHPDLALL